MSLWRNCMIVPFVSMATPLLAQDVETGRGLVDTYCSECHATGLQGSSPFPPAPAFRTLHERYDVVLLEEALVEGLVTGHGAMPEFEFDPDQARAIIDYLNTLQAEVDEHSPVSMSPRAPSAAFGELTFRFYCTACHGQEGRGDSEAAAMFFDPPDLTLLAARSGGDFPADRVRRIIDGRDDIVGHTGVEMTPWARLFAHEMEATDEERERLVQLRIADLVAYLRSIQRD